MNREAILEALGGLASGLSSRGARAELFVVGGAAIALAYDSRRTTPGVDAVYEPDSTLEAAAADVARQRGLPPTWLDNAVRQYVPWPDPDAIPVFAQPGLAVSAASARYLLGMKLISARAERDATDIRTLARMLGIDQHDEVLSAVSALYPNAHISPQTRFLVDELFG